MVLPKEEIIENGVNYTKGDLSIVMEDDKGYTTKEMATKLEISIAHANLRLTKARNKGIVDRRKYSGVLYWYLI